MISIPPFKKLTKEEAKERRRLSNQKWKSNNKDKMKIILKKYWDNNPDFRKARGKKALEYYYKNKEMINNRSKKRRMENKIIREQSKI
jgi:nuclear transport factor 2 (NTF2) superfamily protein